jgi:hypothetical protein
MHAPSVRKALLKKAQEATEHTKAAQAKVLSLQEKFGPGIVQYNKAKAYAVKLLKAFGEDKFDQIASKRLAPVGNDLQQINLILEAREAQFRLGDQFGVGLDSLTKWKHALDEAVQAEKIAWAHLEKYLQDREEAKSLGEKEYAKWKKNVRKELFG